MKAYHVRAVAGSVILGAGLFLLAGCNNGSSSTPNPQPSASCGSPTANTRVYVTDASGSISSNPNSPDTIDTFLISSLLNNTGSTVNVCQQINSQSFSAVFGIATDSSANIYVVDANSSSILEFAANANGTVNPIKTITSTAMSSPYGIAIDHVGNIYVTVPGNSSTSGVGGKILEFGPNQSGSATPIRTIAGSQTLLEGPTGIAVTSKGIYVTNAFGNSVELFGPNAKGNVAPTRVISGTGAGLQTPLGIAVNSAGLIFVSNNQGNSITVYGPSSSTPRRTIAGSNTNINGPAGLAFDSSGNLYVAENGPISSSAPTGQLEIFGPSATGNASPLVNVSGVGFSAWGSNVF
jgi:hemin uptake protein HemP